MKGCMLNMTSQGVSLQQRHVLPIWHARFYLWPLFFFGTQETCHEPGVLRFALDYFPSFPEHRLMCSSIMHPVEIVIFLHYAFQNCGLGGCCNTVAQAGRFFFFTSGHLSLPKPYNCSPTQSVIDLLLLLVYLPFSFLFLSLSPSSLLLYPSISWRASPHRNLVCFKVFPDCKRINKVKPNWFGSKLRWAYAELI